MKEISKDKYSYKSFEIESWQDFDDFKMSSTQCVYRGQGHSEWPLATGYERVQRILNPMREKKILSKFISQAGIYMANLPARNDFVSWFSLMQHYGAGTRLLDVTRSKYIALFFALVGVDENIGSECAVWAFDTYASNMRFYNFMLKSEHDGCIDTRGEPLSSALEEYEAFGWKFANKFIVSDWDDEVSDYNVDCFIEDNMGMLKPRMSKFLDKGGVIRIVPQIQNKRMIAQAAEFLMPITLRKSFEINLFNSEKDFSPSVVKLIIPIDLRQRFLMKLCDMNITWQNVYPDIVGLAQAMNW